MTCAPQHFRCGVYELQCYETHKMTRLPPVEIHKPTPEQTIAQPPLTHRAGKGYCRNPVNIPEV